MKIALITDTHFGARNDNLFFNDYFYKFWDNVFFPYVKDNGIDTIIHLGDIMDRRKFVSYKIAKDFRERFMKPIVDNNLTVHMMVGNHDTFYKNTNEVNSLEELVEGRYPNVKVYPEATTVTFDNTPIMFLPWINTENYSDTMNAINESNAQIAMGHLEVSGFEMHNGHFSESGHPASLFNNKCPKGFHVFDTETRQLERILNPYNIFEKVYYDDTTMDYMQYDVSTLSEKYVKVVVVNKKDMYNFDRFIDKVLSSSGAYEVKIVEDFSDLDASNVDDAIINNAEDTMTLLERYIDELDVNLDKSRLTNMMKSLYVEASDLEL